MYQTKLRRREIGNNEMSFMDAAAPPFLPGALRPEARNKITSLYFTLLVLHLPYSKFWL
jgi:hypothetical protein